MSCALINLRPMQFHKDVLCIFLLNVDLLKRYNLHGIPDILFLESLFGDL